MRIVGHRSNDKPLGWRRADPFKDQFELGVGDRILAMITIGGLVILTAHVESDGWRLSFRADGVGSQRIRIESAPDGEVIGHFDHRWSGRVGTLHLAEGGKLEWRQEGWWRPTYVFTDRFANPLVRLCPDGSVLDCVLGDELASLTSSWHGALLLLALGWFLLVVSGRARPPRLSLAV